MKDTDTGRSRYTGKLENQDPSGTLQKLENQDPSGTLQKPENWDPSGALQKPENWDPTKTVVPDCDLLYTVNKTK